MLWGWTAVVAVASAVVVVLTPESQQSPVDLVSVIGWVLLPTLFTTLGVLILTRQPGNRISWILLTIGAGTLLDGVAEVLLLSPPEEVTVVTWLVIFASNTTWLVIFLSLFNLLYLFPDGSLPSPRWQWVYWVEGLIVGTIVFLGITSESIGPVSDAWLVPNPIGFVSEDFFSGAFEIGFSGLLLSVVGGGFAAMIVRWRRSPRMVRTQIKWVLFAGVLFLVGYSLAFVGSIWSEEAGVLNIFFVPSIAAIPVAITGAILRFRLYDIDRIISRTVSYGVVVAVLVAVYVQGIALLTGVLPLDSDVAVAGSTLLVAALFTPLRRVVQGRVDRRFNRTSYAADQELEKFSTQLKTISESAAIEGELLDVARRTLEPHTSAVWIKSTSS